ncbi:hypothetical protein N9O41_00425, partial [Crocinitomicaceae bacterium]|nr:hypothetical protein [Crocinitomicaceae bacterium]
MRNISCLIILIIVGFGFQSFSQTSVEMSNKLNSDTVTKIIAFEKLEGTFYASEDPNLKVTFEELYDYQINFDGNPTNLLSNRDILIKNLERGDHTITLISKDNLKQVSKSFKVKASRPWFSNDATVFGLLMIVLYFVFRTANSQRNV